MNDKITTSSVQDFLKDFLANSETQILEEGKETDDILSVAEARGYNLKNRLALAGFKTIYTFADKANDNKARLPKEVLLKVLPEIIGTPVNIDHIRDYVVGHYIDYRYKATEDMIIAYGVFYKANFGDEWKKAQKLFKENKLGTSYEIYCPKSKRKYLPDGTYQLTVMEIAGGALIFKEKPAFEDAKVLEVAKKIIEDAEADLVIASVKKFNEEDIITSSTEVPDINKEAVHAPIVTEVSKPVESVVVPQIAPVIPKIKCQNCQKEFDNTGFIATQSEKKCPHCQAIVGEQGEIKYPPQIIDFNMSCPSCRSSNWKLIKSDDVSNHVQCMSCKKEYKFAFDKQVANPLISAMAFVHISSANCLQCGTSIPFSTTSQVKNLSVACPHCGLKFNVDITKLNSKRKISKIEEVADLNKASAEGGSEEMEQENIVPNVEPVVAAPVAIEPLVVAPVVVEPTVVGPVAEVPVVAPAEVVDEVPASAVEPIVSIEVKPEVAEPVTTTVVESSEVLLEVAEVKSPVAKPTVTQEQYDELELQLCKAKAKHEKLVKCFKAACKAKRTLHKASSLNKASVEVTEATKQENEELKTKIQFLETSAVKIVERKNMLGDAAKDLSDKDIMDDGKFEVARIKQENDLLKSQLVTASAHVAVKTNIKRSDNEIAQIAKSIDEKSFPKK